MLNRRRFAKVLGAAMLSAASAPALIRRSSAQGAPAAVARGHYLIKNGALITVDPLRGVLPRADVHVRDGRIEAIGPDLQVAGAEIIDATDMIVMPGLVDTHHHMWSALGRNFVRDGLGYFQAKAATSNLYQADDFYNSVMLGLVELANAGITTVHNWSHNTRSPTHADAELRAHRDAMLRARYAYGHIDQMPRNQALDFTDIDRVKRDYFGSGAAFEGLVTFGVNLRGVSQSDEATYHRDMQAAMERDLPVAIHASQAPPNVVDTEDYERRGWLGPKLLICHYIPARDIDAEILARTRTPLSFATLSLTCTKRNRSSVSEFSISLCSSTLRFPRVFSASIPSMSIAWRAAGRSKVSSVSSDSFSRPSRISACIFRENTRNSKVGGGRGMPESDIRFYL